MELHILHCIMLSLLAGCECHYSICTISFPLHQWLLQNCRQANQSTSKIQKGQFFGENHILTYIHPADQCDISHICIRKTSQTLLSTKFHAKETAHPEHKTGPAPCGRNTWPVRIVEPSETLNWLLCIAEKVM